MDEIVDHICGQWRDMQATLARQIEMIESGKMGAGDRIVGSRTAATLARLKAQHAELDALLAEYASRR